MLPCRTVATDIETGERISIGTGKLETAYRASSSVPMVMTPIKVGERVLVDGGVADPVPAEVAIEMGADLTVAVNVVPRMKRGVETVLSAWYRRINAFNPLTYLVDAEDMPNLFDIVMNSMQILQYELGNFKSITRRRPHQPRPVRLHLDRVLPRRRADRARRRRRPSGRCRRLRRPSTAKIAPIRRAAPRGRSRRWSPSHDARSP